jgi:23S rRNA pseudouridine1911/1915/1917 synthase
MEPGRYNLKAGEADKGKRIDKYIVEKLPGLSRSFVQKLATEGRIFLNGEPASKRRRINTGEAVDISIPEPAASTIRAEKVPLNIVYEDEDLLVVNKPAGMVVHPAPGNYSGTLVNALLAHCKDLSGIGGVLKPGVVHRIDKGTSGLLVVAKNDLSHRALAGQFKAKTSRRVYWAVVKGIVRFDNGTVELPIGRSPADRKKMTVKSEDGRDAVTVYKVLERFKDSTLLELTLGTGRTHQIRVHMSHIGHPVVGDEEYGSRAGLGRPALHAKTIGFIHPVTKKYLEFTSELPDDIKELVAAARARAGEKKKNGVKNNKTGKKITRARSPSRR